MKKLKKVLKIFFIVLFILIGLLFATPYIFKGKIVALVKKEINKKINAKVDFKDVNISFFRHFPKVSIGLDKLQIVGTGYFAADTLLYADRLDATADIISFIKGKEMSIYKIYLQSPRINVLVNKDGFANWDILKTNESQKEETVDNKPFNLQLKEYSIKNGYINYDDRQSNMSAIVKNFNHTGSGDFTSNLFSLKTNTTADEFTYTYGGVPFLNKVNTSITGNIKIDNKINQYSFDEMEVLINNLKVNVNGNVNSLANGYGININFKSASTGFKNILSLIPAVYKTDFDKVTANGNAILEGFIKGNYSDTTMPGYHLVMQVKDGSFKYADLPKSVQQINFNAVVDNPDGQTDNTVVDVSNGHLQIDTDPFDFRVLVKKPISNMFIDAAAKGKLNLSEVANYVKLDKGTSIAGLMNADINIKGNVKDIEKQQYNNFYAAGSINVLNFNYTSTDYPTGIKINSLQSNFTPTKIDISDLSGQYKNSNFSAEGQIYNLLSYLLSGNPLKAALTINADKVNLTDWIGEPASNTKTQQTSSTPFVVPSNLDVSVSTKIKQLNYDNLAMNDLSGALQIADETVKFNNINANALDGNIKINGSYSTKENKTRPAVFMNYDVDKVDIQKTFYAFNSAQKLMPIGKFLAGKLTSSLLANGRLGENMDIDMHTISGNGNVLLIEGFLSKFAPLDKIASTLGIKELEQISLKDVKTFFEFSNGKLLVKPFNIKIKDIEMEIGGLQGIGMDEGINYAINLKLPRVLMGKQGSQFVDNLVTTANAKGIPVKLGETVNLKMSMGGTIKSPTLKVDLKQSGETLADQMKSQVKDFAQAKIDSAKTAAKDTLISIKKQLEESAKEELRKNIFGKKDSTNTRDSTSQSAGEKTKQSVKGLLDNLLKKKQKDTANKQ